MTRDKKKEIQSDDSLFAAALNFWQNIGEENSTPTRPHPSSLTPEGEDPSTPALRQPSLESSADVSNTSSMQVLLQVPLPSLHYITTNFSDVIGGLLPGNDLINNQKNNTPPSQAKGSPLTRRTEYITEDSPGEIQPAPPSSTTQQDTEPVTPIVTTKENVSTRTGCLPHTNFLAKLLSKFSLSKSKNTDKESVVSTTAGSATPSRPASTIAESERGSTTAGSPSRPASTIAGSTRASTTAGSARGSERGSTTAGSETTPSRSTTAGSATPSRPAATAGSERGSTRARAGSPARPAATAGSAKKSLKERFQERFQESWHNLKLHKSADGRGDGREEEVQGLPAIALDVARWLKNTPRKASTSFQKLRSGLSERISEAYSKISSFKIPKFPERPVVNQQPLTFTRNTPRKTSFSKKFSDGVRELTQRYSEVMNDMRNSTDTYTLSRQKETTSFSTKALGFIKEIQDAYKEYKEKKAYHSYRSSHTSSGPTLSFPTPPTSQDIQNAANKFNSGASFVAKFLKDGASKAADSAASRASRIASNVRRTARTGTTFASDYTTPSVHATWFRR